MNSLDELQRDRTVEGKVTWREGRGGLTMGRLSVAGAAAEFYLHGAHVTHFAREGATPVLFVSKRSLFQADKPIRGGIPVTAGDARPGARRPWRQVRPDEGR